MEKVKQFHGILPVNNMPPLSMGGPVLSRFLQAVISIHKVD
jgi:hypothetical protein